MKVIKADVNDEIYFNTIEDIDTGIITGITSTLKLPTGNLNNILIDFNFINKKLCEELNIFATFDIDEKRCIDVELTKITVDNITYENACYIPAEVFENPCYFMLGLYGFALEDENKIKQRISLVPLKNIVVKGSYDPNSKEGITPTPTVFEKYFDKIDKATEELKNTMITYQKYETVYTSKNDGEKEITIDIEEYVEDEGMLFVKVNGLDLIETVEYTVAGNKITLVEGVSKDTPVHIVYLKPMKEDIKNLGYKIEELEEEIESLYNDFKPNTVSGESTIVNNGVKGSKVEVIGDGNSYQETTEGYQLLDYTKGYYINTKKQPEFIDNGFVLKASTEDYRIVSFETNLKANTSYILQCDYEKISGSASEPNLYLPDIEQYIRVNFPFTPKANSKQIGLYLQPSQVDTVFNITNIRLYEEIHQNKPYEPYTNGVASPSPEYEQPIEVIDGVNRFDFEKLKELDNTITGTAENFTLTNGDNTIQYKDIPKGQITIKGKYSSTFMNANLRIYYTDGTNDTVFGIYDNSSVNETKFDFKSNATKEIDYIRFVTFGKDIGSNITYKELMIYKGTDDKPYLQYGHIGLLQSGKNIYDGELELGNLENGINAEHPEVFRSKNYMKVNPNTQYIFSVNGKAHRIIISLYDKDKKYIGSNITGLIAENGLFTTYENARYLRFRSYAADISVITNGKIMLEQNNVVTEYAPHQEKLIPINLNGNSIAKVGDTKDLLNIGVNGSVKIGDKVIKRYVFTGDENIGKSSNTSADIFSYNLGITDTSGTSEIKCNYLVYKDTNIIGSCRKHNNYIYLIPYTYGTATTDEFKAWLKEKYDSGEPLYIDYVSATPTTIELPSIEPIKLFEGTNNFELVTNLGTTLSVTYKVSNNARLEALEKAVLEIGGNE